MCVDIILLDMLLMVDKEHIMKTREDDTKSLIILVQVSHLHILPTQTLIIVVVVVVVVVVLLLLLFLHWVNIYKYR